MVKMSAGSGASCDSLPGGRATSSLAALLVACSGVAVGYSSPPAALSGRVAVTARSSASSLLALSAPKAPSGEASAHPYWRCSQRAKNDTWHVASGHGPDNTTLTDVLTSKVGEHNDAVRGVALIADKIIASVGDDDSLRLWDPCASPAEMLKVNIGQGAEAVTTTAERVAAADDSGSVWTGEPPSWSLRRLAIVGKAIKAVTFSPDGTTLAVGGHTDSVRLLDVKSGKLLGEAGRGHGLIYSVSWAPSGKLLAFGAKDGSIGLLDWNSTKLRARLPLQRANFPYVSSVAFTCDGSHIIIARGASEDTNESEIEVWDLAKRALARTLAGHELGIHAVAVSCQGLIASAGADSTVRLWSLQTGEPIVTITAAAEPVHSLAFSADGTYLATGSGRGKLHGEPGEDNSVRLYWLAALLPRVAR